MKRAIYTAAIAATCLLTACSPKAAPPAPSASAPASVAAPAAPHDILSCTVPLSPRTMAAMILKTYGAAAKAADIPGAEGMTAKGVLLNPGKGGRTLEILWWDTAQTAISGITAHDAGRNWTGPDGLHVGATVAEVQAANGRPFAISGFDWDYGGYVVDFKGGKLASLTGGCTLGLRFDNRNEKAVEPDGISGDGVTVMSDDPRLKTFAPTVSELSIQWAQPDGVVADTSDQ